MSDDTETKPAAVPMGELAASNDRLDITKPYVSALQINQDSVLTARGGGLEVYEEVLRDDQVYSCFQQRRAAVTSRELVIDAGGTDKASEMMADFTRELLTAQSMMFDDKTDKMMYARFYGYGHAEMMWAQDGRNIFLDKIKVRRARRFRFGKDGELRLLTRDAPDGVVMPEKKFWTITAGADNDDQPYGLGLAHWCYWPAWFKRNNLKLWMIFNDKFGGPTAVGKYPPSATKEDQTKLLQAARALQQSSAVTIPEKMMLELLEATRSGTGTYDVAYDKFDAAISKIILSQTMTTDSGASLSQSQVHWDVGKQVTKSDSDIQSASFTAGPLTWLRDWNYPDAELPIVTRSFDEPEDLDKRATRDKTIYDMGFEPTEDYVRETYGGEWTKRATPPPPDPFADNFAKRPPLFAEGDGKRAAPDPIAAAAAERARRFDELLKPARDQLQVAFNTVGNFDQLKASLEKLRQKLDMRALATRLEADTLQALGQGVIGDTLKSKAEFAEVEVRSSIKPDDALKALRTRLANPHPSFSWLDVQREQHSEIFTVAKSAGFDILDDVGEAVDTAIANGETFETFQKKLTPILIDKGWWGVQEAVDPLTGETVAAQLGSAERLRIIFDTNMRTSYSAGHWIAAERNKADQPYLMYVAVHDSRTRPEHRAWDGTTLPVDDPWWDTHYPPCGWNCRCTAVALSERQTDQLDRAGRISLDAPDSPTRAVTNPRTGETVDVPDGVDPDFAYNPGKALLQRLMEG